MFEFLQAALAELDPYLTRIDAEPYFDPFRCDPPYCDLLGRMDPTPTVGVYRVQRRCPANEPMATEGRILFEPPRAGAPRTSPRSFLRVGPGSTGCCHVGPSQSRRWFSDPGVVQRSFPYRWLQKLMVKSSYGGTKDLKGVSERRV
jgi:hypothetical protein